MGGMVRGEMDLRLFSIIVILDFFYKPWALFIDFRGVFVLR